MEIAGRRALVTGATGGLGRAIARALHEQGAHVLVTGRRAEVLEQLVNDLGERAEALPADLSKAGGVKDLTERAGEVDILVANAGLPGSGRLDDYSHEEIDRAIDVNLRAPIHLSRAFLPRMLERGSGHLVFISSISGKVALSGGAIYSGTKFGLRGFAFALRDDLRGTGVGVTTVFPGFISDAGLWADTGLSLPAGTGTRTPEDVAQAVIRGIERNKAEIDVAPLTQRAGGWLWPLAPSLVAGASRAAGGTKLAQRMAEAQREKR